MTLKYCLSACLSVLLARRRKDNLISIPWDAANRHTAHQTHWWEWAKFESHHSEKHPILITQVGKGDSFRWSAHLVLHLPGFTPPFTAPTMQPRAAAVTETFLCVTQAFMFTQSLSAPWHTAVSFSLQTASTEESKHTFRKLFLDINYSNCYLAAFFHFKNVNMSTSYIHYILAILMHLLFEMKFVTKTVLLFHIWLKSSSFQSYNRMTWFAVISVMFQSCLPYLTFPCQNNVLEAAVDQCLLIAADLVEKWLWMPWWWAGGGVSLTELSKEKCSSQCTQIYHPGSDPADTRPTSGAPYPQLW